MHPTVSENLRETGRILRNVVMPHVGDEYARHILAEAIETLRVVEASWARVLPFLHEDNQLSADLLKQLSLGAELASAFSEMEELAGDAVFDFFALERRNKELNSLIESAIAQSTPQDLRRIKTHLLDRTGRQPTRRHKAEEA